MEKRTVYVAGPMRGYPRFNFEAFELAQKYLESMGFNVLSPHRMDLEIGFDPTKSLEANGFNMADAARRDMEAILVSDFVAVLPGWENSKGATAEKAIAEWLDKPVMILEGKI